MFKIGQRVKCNYKGIRYGEVAAINPDLFYCVYVVFEDDTAGCYTEDGKFYAFQQEPSLTIVPGVNDANALLRDCLNQLVVLNVNPELVSRIKQFINA